MIDDDFDYVVYVMMMKRKMIENVNENESVSENGNVIEIEIGNEYENVIVNDFENEIMND